MDDEGKLATVITLSEYRTLLVWSALILGYLHDPWLQHNHLSLKEYSCQQNEGRHLLQTVLYNRDPYLYT